MTDQDIPSGPLTRKTLFDHNSCSLPILFRYLDVARTFGRIECVLLCCSFRPSDRLGRWHFIACDSRLFSLSQKQRKAAAEHGRVPRDGALRAVTLCRCLSWLHSETPWPSLCQVECPCLLAFDRCSQGCPQRSSVHPLIRMDALRAPCSSNLPGSL